MLVDYDNVEELNRRRGLVDLVETMLDKLPESVAPDNAITSVRLYGGWYEQNRLTTLAQNLQSEIVQRFPTVFQLEGKTNLRRIRTIVELARSLLICPGKDLFNTLRHRRGAPRFHSAPLPYDNCAKPENCALSKLKRILRASKCPAETCVAKFQDAFTLPQQKLVDTMITSDAIFVAHSLTATKLVVVTNDDDLWPGICTAGRIGAAIYHIHPQRGRRTPDRYLPLAPPAYYQCSF